MEANDSLNNLKGLHEEFLNSSYFSALSIMTPKKDWLCIHRDDKYLNETYFEAKKRSIFNLVVMDGHQVSGFINIKYIKKRNEEFTVDWNKMEKVEEQAICETLSLFDLLKKMVGDAKKVKRRMSPLYFVLPSKGSTKEPIGVISFWDLNRAPTYILSYPILVYLEHTLIFKIRHSHKQWVEHVELLTQIGRHFGVDKHEHNRFKKFLSAPEYNHSILSKCGFPELVYFYENDPHIERDGDEVIKNLIGLFKKNRKGNKKFRNMIAHTVNLIVDGQEFMENLEDLDKIWDYGKVAFSNFINPKLSYSTPIINESDVTKKSKNR